MGCSFRKDEECVLLKEYVKNSPFSTVCSNENGSYAGELCNFMKIDSSFITSALTEYMEGSHFREMRSNNLTKGIK